HLMKDRREPKARIISRYEPTAKVTSTWTSHGEQKYIKVATRSGKHPSVMMIPPSREQLAAQHAEPVKISPGYWLYHDYWVEFEDTTYRQDDAALLVKRAVLREERELARARQEVETLERFGDLPSACRDAIPDEARMFVWQRDGGRCVRCGGREKLEFDHITPVADGGSSTERNVQLLCEPCNLSKGRSVSSRVVAKYLPTWVSLSSGPSTST